jgi:hypothetical protein
MSKPFLTTPSTPFTSSYLDSRHLQTKNHIAKLRKDKQAKESLELSTRNYPSKNSQQIIQKLYQTKPSKNNNTLSDKSIHESLRSKSAKRVYDNFLHNFVLSTNLQLDIAKARQPENLIKTLQIKNNIFNKSLPYKNYSPMKKRFTNYYNVANNKKDTFIHSTHPTINTTKVIKPKIVNVNTKAHQREYMNGIGYSQLLRIHEQKKKELARFKPNNKKVSLSKNYNDKNTISLEQKRKQDINKFYLSMT